MDSSGPCTFTVTLSADMSEELPAALVYAALWVADGDNDPRGRSWL